MSRFRQPTSPVRSTRLYAAVAPLMDELESRCHLSGTPVSSMPTPPTAYAPHMAAAKLRVSGVAAGLTASLANVPATGAEGSPISINSIVSDSDPSATLTYGWTVYRNGQHVILPDGTNISGSSLQFTPSDNGNYVVRLTVLDSHGASVTVNSTPIAVANVAPTASITGTPANSVSEGTPLSFTVAATDAGADDTLSYLWTVTKDGQSYPLPNGAITNGTTFGFTPGDNGTFLVTCQVTDKDGAMTVATSGAFAVTNVAPTVTLSGQPSGAINEGDPVSLTANVTDPGTDDTFTYAWSVTKDGNPYDLGSTAANGSTFTFAPNDNGTYIVTLNMADDDGGTATATTSSIVVNNVAPIAQITGPLSGQEGSPLSFSAVVTDPGAADTFIYAWSVTKDGNPFTLPSDVDAASRSFSFTPPDNGSYDISLDVTDKDGASAATVTRTVNVLNAAPWVSIIGAPQASDEGTQINLSASALDPGVNDTLTYAWSVTKNGNPYTLPGGTVVDGSTFSFTPDDEGTFVASVTVTDNDGGQTTVTAQIAALNVAPTLTITGEPSSAISEGDSVHLYTQLTDPGVNDSDWYYWTITKDGQPWTPDVNTVTNGNELVFTPTDNGTYVATAHVTDNGGGSDSVDSLPIVVNNVAPTAGIAGAPSGAVNENAPLTFTSNSTDPGSADTFTYAWSVTKDGDPYTLPDTVDTTGAAFTFTPGHSGSYVVSMTITDKDGASDSTSTAAITVDNVAPTGTINGPTAANEGDALTLTAEPVDGADNTLTYAWSVEKDGNPFTLPGDAVTDQQAFDFTPPDQGSYVFTCTVTDDQGASNDLTQTVAVANVAPNVALQAMPTLAKEGVAVTLGSDVTDPGVNDTLVYGWTIKKDGVAYALPNGTVDDQPTFTFTPTDNGTYAATLTVLDGDGGSTTVHGTPFVVGNVAPSASIDVPGSTPLENQPFTLTSTVTDASPDDQAAGFTYEWIAQRNGEVTDTGFDDSFTFTPTVHGVYTITLVATDKDGGVSSTSTDLEVGNVAPSNAAITGLPGTMTEADSATLTASADDAPDDSLTYQWTVTRNGNAFAQASGDSFNFSPHVRGDFGITLTATDSAGASTSTTQSITVANVAPSVSLTQPKYTVLLGENAPFKVSLGDIPKNQSLAMTIDFGDGTVKQETFTGNQVNLGLNHTYADAGNYSVSVSVSDGVSVSSVTKSVSVSRAAVRIDPLDSTKTALVVIGSDSADDINVYTAGTRRYGVIYDGQILGSSYYPTGRVVISGGAGADDIQVNATLPALIFAGDTGSTLKGGNGNDILIGGSGADYIDGRGGRDIIISQGGPDTLLGGDGEDLILPSLAAWANNTASLKSIYATWNGSGATADRLAALQSGGLFSNQAVTTDSVSDIIYGQGGDDAFAGVGATDRIRDFTTGDVTQS